MQGLHTKVIVNPEAGSCSVRRDWPHISRRLQKAGLSFDYEFTEGTGQAIEIASRAINSGYNYLIAVGGDGTVNEVANGILRSNNSLNVILGIECWNSTCPFLFLECC
jgi:diacylglycerol kinase family enzyme